MKKVILENIYYFYHQMDLGNPVKNRSCTRSCNPIMLVATSATVPENWDGKAATNWGEPEDLPFNY